jgi:hypothetical protein
MQAALNTNEPLERLFDIVEKQTQDNATAILITL